jgi:hypothetical protein
MGWGGRVRREVRSWGGLEERGIMGRETHATPGGGGVGDPALQRSRAQKSHAGEAWLES